MSVTLKLVSLRVSEAGPLLLPHFGALAQALRAAGKALQQWSPLFQEAAAALQAAERAHKEAVFHQVHALPCVTRISSSCFCRLRRPSAEAHPYHMHTIPSLSTKKTSAPLPEPGLSSTHACSAIGCPIYRSSGHLLKITVIRSISVEPGAQRYELWYCV